MQRRLAKRRLLFNKGLGARGDGKWGPVRAVTSDFARSRRENQWWRRVLV